MGRARRRENDLEIKYFPDTDTLLINFTNSAIAETTDATENALIELGEEGEVVSITIERASDYMDLDSFLYRKIAAESP